MIEAEEIQQEDIVQMRFEFNQWKDCFKTWHDNEEEYKDKMQLVISTHWATSGYWIEAKGKPLTKGDEVYIGKQVYALEKRIIKEHERAAKKFTSPRFTI